MKPISDTLDSYFSGESHEIRMNLLAELAQSGSGFDPAAVVGLLGIELPAAEKLALLEAAFHADPAAFEDFVFDHMIHWPADVAAKALRLWAESPTCSRWSELVRLAPLPGLPQRVLYTILDVSVRSPDDALARACVDAALNSAGKLSAAFNALLFMRMVQRNIRDDRVSILAGKICEKSVHEFVPEDKSAFTAWIFLWFFHSADFERLQATVAPDSPQTLFGFLPDDRSLDWLGKSVEFSGKIKSGANSRKPIVKSAPGKPTKVGDMQVVRPGSDNGAGACLAWLLSRDMPAERIRNQVTGVWQQLLVVGDLDEPDERWTAAANSMRSRTGIYKIACIRAIGKRRGSDHAVLKLLDFVRSGETRELTEVARALGSIASPRAVQELIAMISRENADFQLQFQVAEILKCQTLNGHRDAILAAGAHMAGLVKVARRSGSASEGLVEIWETLVDIAEASGGPVVVTSSGIDARVMDEALGKSIPHYEKLSAEVKRALRTAWYFHRQIEGGAAVAASIDLSPVIDMQYKAMELLFREYFEDACLRLVQQGTIQRKLDLIGYSRPIHEKMDEFEAYIAGMPVIKAIPFFSKFKLRKMLLALCQFKPGRRFTLDGLKAFGLFFFVFGRSECRFGLAGILPAVPDTFRDQAALADFCRLLHIFQDFRNRAAHEGFHPDAAADINGIWRNTAEIVQSAHALNQFLRQSRGEPGLVRGRAS